MKKITMKNIRKLVLMTCMSLLCLNTLQTTVTTVHAEGDDTEQTTSANNPYSGGWSNCTWSAWQLVYEATGIALPSLGNAGSWYANAAAAGYTVSTEPRANSVGVWSGHVVYVTDFDGQNIYLKEGGFLGGYNEAWADGYSARYGEALIGYIYIPGDMSEVSAPTWTEQFNSTSYVGTNATTQNGVERAISSEVEGQDIENLEEEIIKKYDPELVEKKKSEEEKAMQDMLKEEQDLTSESSTQAPVTSSSQTASLAASMLAPLITKKK